jgi:hypothetical protein
MSESAALGGGVAPRSGRWKRIVAITGVSSVVVVCCAGVWVSDGGCEPAITARLDAGL